MHGNARVNRTGGDRVLTAAVVGDPLAGWQPDSPMSRTLVTEDRRLLNTLKQYSRSVATGHCAAGGSAVPGC